MSSSTRLKLLPATAEDIPSMTDLWFAAFSAPEMRDIFPDTPGVRTWLEQVNLHDISNKPLQRYVKVVDTTSLDEYGRMRIAAWAKWDLGTPAERGARYLPWHEDLSAKTCDEFFGRLEINRNRVMGTKKHYYLDTLCTHPEYFRQGAASMLVRWGCELADSDGVAAYVDASKDGAPLYTKFGFVDLSDPGESVASMART